MKKENVRQYTRSDEAVEKRKEKEQKKNRISNQNQEQDQNQNQEDTANTTTNIIDEMGVITEETTIHGSVETKGNLEIFGTVEGDIKANGNITVSGVVKGNIDCENLTLDRCLVTSEIHALGNILVKNGATVEGKIFCDNLTLDGIVKGTIVCNNSMILSSHSVIEGDINTGAIGAESGAKINGNIKMKQ